MVLVCNRDYCELWAENDKEVADYHPGRRKAWVLPALIWVLFLVIIMKARLTLLIQT